MEYFKKVSSAFNMLRKNLVLFIPSIFITFFSLVLLFIVLQIFGITSILINNSFNLEPFFEEVKEVFSNSSVLLKFIISFVIFLIITALFSLIARITELNMIKKIINNKKPNLKRSFIESKDYFWQLLFVYFIIFLLFSIPLLIIITLQLNFQIFYLTIILFLLYLVYLVFLTLSLLFLYPSLFLKTKQPINALKNSFTFFKVNKKHTLLTLLVILLIVFAVNYILIPLNYLPYLNLISYVLVPLLIIVYIIRFVIKIAISLWVKIYIFVNYKKH